MILSKVYCRNCYTSKSSERKLALEQKFLPTKRHERFSECRSTFVTIVYQVLHFAEQIDFDLTITYTIQCYLRMIHRQKPGTEQLLR